MNLLSPSGTEFAFANESFKSLLKHSRSNCCELSMFNSNTPLKNFLPINYTTNFKKRKSKGLNLLTI